MFIELTNKKRNILFPLSAISVHQQPDGAVLVKELADFDYFVDESYEDIVSTITFLLYNEDEKVARV